MIKTKSRIIVKETSTAQWCDLVAEASQANKIKLDEDLESYLVFLLMRFASSPEIVKKIMAISLLESANQAKNQKQQTLREIGDSCLLFAGLFPGIAQKRRLRVSYYVKVGQTAYTVLSESDDKNNNIATLFHALGEQFVPLMDVLQAMRELNGSGIPLDPIQAEEIWSDTGSSHALKVLKQFSSEQASVFGGIPITSKYLN